MVTTIQSCERQLKPQIKSISTGGYYIDKKYGFTPFTTDIWVIENINNLTEQELSALACTSTRKYIIGNLARLAAHKTMKGSDQAKKFIFEDIADDLDGVCSGAVNLACAYFRRDSDNIFFPNTSDFESVVNGISKSIDKTLKNKIKQYRIT